MDFGDVVEAKDYTALVKPRIRVKCRRNQIGSDILVHLLTKIRALGLKGIQSHDGVELSARIVCGEVDVTVAISIRLRLAEPYLERWGLYSLGS